MRLNRYSLVFVCCFLLSGRVFAAYPGQDDVFPFAPAAGQTGSTAIAKDDIGIVAWATGFTELSYGDAVAQQWKTPVKALGPAVGDSFDVVSLGRGGEITLTFTNSIRDGAGVDFAVFENGFSDTFLELAWVEVSTDGEHFVRFPNFSYTESATGAINATFVHGYASKYRKGYGTPLDLDQLQLAYDAAVSGTDTFEAAYKQHLIDNFPEVDLDDIRYVRIVDIVGDGSEIDAEGYAIYDPYPTTGSAGLDLDAIGVLNQIEPIGDMQAIVFPEIAHQRISEGSLQLAATASSGLPVSYEILEGPGTLSGDTLSFTGLGQVVVRAMQPGDATYAPAAPIAQSFYIADELQHIYFEPVANQVTNTSVDLHAVTTSGFLPVIEIVSGPSDVSAGFPPNQALQTSATTGTVVMRAYQVGGTLNGVTYAPADDVIMTVEVVSPGSAAAPMSFAAWQAANSISGTIGKDSDLDGAVDFEEFVAGSDPNDSKERPVYRLERTEGEDGFVVELVVSRLASVRVAFEANEELNDVSSWSEIIPNIIDISTNTLDQRTLRLRLPMDGAASRQFWRFEFNAN